MCIKTFIWSLNNSQRFLTLLNCVLSRFSWDESYVDYLLRANLSAHSTSGPLRLLQKQRRERERWPSQGHLLLDVLKLWNSERICTSLVSPRTFFLLHTYTHLFPHKSPAWMTATFSGPQKKLLLEQKEEKKSKRNCIKSTHNDQPHWTLKGKNMDVKSPTRTKQTF